MIISTRSSVSLSVFIPYRSLLSARSLSLFLYTQHNHYIIPCYEPLHIRSPCPACLRWLMQQLWLSCDASYASTCTFNTHTTTWAQSEINLSHSHTFHSQQTRPAWELLCWTTPTTDQQQQPSHSPVQPRAAISYYVNRDCRGYLKSTLTPDTTYTLTCIRWWALH